MADEDERIPRLHHQLMFFLMISRKYLIALTYVAFYIAFCERENAMANNKQFFVQIRDRLLGSCKSLDDYFEKTIVEGDLVKIKKFVTRDMLCDVYDCSEQLTQELKTIVPVNKGTENQPSSKSVQELGLLRAPTHLLNCMLGFAHIYQFIRKIPLQQQYQVTEAQMEVLIKVFEQDLLPNWKNQVESLKRHIGILMLVDKNFLQKFESYRTSMAQKKTEDTNQTLSYDGWLRTQINELGLQENFT